VGAIQRLQTAGSASLVPELPAHRHADDHQQEQSIVHIKVLDPATQRTREGYLRLGSYWWGALDFNAAEIRWQGE